ncbi:EamA family transporter [Celerinatantimonas sp. YJH-8]|uniref:EamA family transporter n=1 Tax=Celerinatantimonas sp. YJH-8 TaxID=3228714 RepID=UPI0038C813A8
MSVKDMLLALAVVVAWGINFVVIKVGLEGMPPLLLAGLRFLFTAIPAVFFIKLPKVPFKWVALYGLTINFGQFSLLFIALKLGLPAGIASLLLQAQAFFTLLIGTFLFKEQLKFYHLLAMLLAIGGILLLALPHSGDGGHVTLLTLLLIMGAALSWGLGNITNKVIVQRYSVNMMSLVVWGSFVPMFGFMLSSLLFEGPHAMANSILNIQWHNVLALVYLSGIASIMGYGSWGYLLGRYETWRIAPLSLLIPVIGLISANLLLGENLNAMQITGALVIGLALIINLFGNRIITLLQLRLAKPE